MSINVQALSRSFGRQKAVDAVSFSATPGRVLGFLGPNGAGKSTTMKMLTGYLSPDSGTATISGFDVQGDPAEVRRRIGYLPENNPLYTDLYVREALLFFAGVHRLHDPERKIDAVIDRVGLTPERHKKIAQLSKGYRQRVGLAQAILHDPEVLIFDEPTTGLDPNQLVGIRALIRELGRNKTVVLSTHIMQEVEAVCDDVVIISRGKIVAADDLQILKEKHGGKSLENIFHEVTRSNELLGY
ncbi:MAG: ATP-binding cassette domain-containing protein [Mucilaginibacter polytrichastri]|nr:ATP-binding cassette domain-containing protein [Mucilaginibacter polytrichastri]